MLTLFVTQSIHLLDGLTIVYDGANGAASSVGPEILSGPWR